MEKIKLKMSRLVQKLNGSKARIRVLPGGSRSGKSYSACQHLVIQALEAKRPLQIMICRAKLTWLKSTILLDFKNVCRDLGQWDEDLFNKSDMTYQLNGCTFTFVGLDDTGKLHGRKSDIAYINEIFEVDLADFDQIEMRCTGYIVVDGNPTGGAEHWLYTRVMTRPDAAVFHSTFRDNPFLEPAIVKKILSYEPNDANDAAGSSDFYMWSVYGLGQPATREGAVYTNYAFVRDFPVSAKVWYGADFGFTNDPTAVVRCCLQDGELWVDQLVYERGLTTRDLADAMEAAGVEKGRPVYCDSADPRSIEDLHRFGWNALPVTKGPDSVRNGIDVLRQYRLNVTERSGDLRTELQNYTWRKDKNGQALNEPVDKWNHCFVGDTLVETESGPRRIDSISEGDMVVTRAGLRRVTRVFDQGLREVRTYSIDDQLITCTPDHRFWCKETGFTDIYTLSLTQRATLCVLNRNKDICPENHTGWTERSSSIEELSSTGGRALTQSHPGDTSPATRPGAEKAEKDYIATCGNARSAQYRRDTTSTTLTETHSTTQSETSSASAPLSTPSCTCNQRNEEHGAERISTSTAEQPPQSGTGQPRAELGTQSTAEQPRRPGELSIECATSVAPSSWPCTERIIGIDSARGSAATATSNAGGAQTTPESPTRTERVYDIEVEGEHEFFANGVLVHNCLDALRYAALMELRHRTQGPILVGQRRDSVRVSYSPPTARDHEAARTAAKLLGTAFVEPAPPPKPRRPRHGY